jgi:cytochrome c oxidase subunit 3
MYFHSYAYGNIIALISLILIIIVSYSWWRDIAREATYQGWHTLVVQRGLRYGMLLFILSEVMFFFSFFWAFFHSSLWPDIQIGAVWLIVGI